ncbi:MAG: glycosyltransferase [Chloroflexota bacterium]
MTVDRSIGARPNARRERLRIAYIASSLRPGGSERQMLALAARLPTDRFAVDFVTLSDPGVYAEQARAMGANVLSLGETAPPTATLPARLGRRLLKSQRFVTILRKGGYSIVDAWMYPISDLAALTRPVTRIPVVITGRRNLRGPGAPLDPRPSVDALAARMTDAIVANSAAAARDAISREHVARRKVRVIYNGVEAIDPLRPDERETIRAGWGVGSTEIVVGCVANYRDVKGLDVLIAAVGALAPRYPGLRLVLVGEGPSRPGLEGLVQELGLEGRVRLHGSELDARSLVGAFDIVALLSRSEGFPNALLEAASAGLPIVATAAGGIPEIVADGRTGLLVPVDDAGAAARAIERLCGDVPFREQLGAAAREHVTRTFGMDRFVRQFVTLYESLAIERGLLS